MGGAAWRRSPGQRERGQLAMIAAGGDTLGWRVYERVLACCEVEQADLDVPVTPNASLIGSVSGMQQQVGVLVEAR